jgi:hypothetical protein
MLEDTWLLSLKNGQGGKAQLCWTHLVQWLLNGMFYTHTAGPATLPHLNLLPWLVFC